MPLEIRSVATRSGGVNDAYAGSQKLAPLGSFDAAAKLIALKCITQS